MPTTFFSNMRKGPTDPVAQRPAIRAEVRTRIVSKPAASISLKAAQATTKVPLNRYTLSKSGPSSSTSSQSPQPSKFPQIHKAASISRPTAALRPEKRKQGKPSTPLFTDDSEGEDDIVLAEPSKKLKTWHQYPRDLNRRLGAKEASLAVQERDVSVFIHGIDISSGEYANAYSPLFDLDIASDASADLTSDLSEAKQLSDHLTLQYPGSSQHEKFALLRPKKSDEYKPVEDIIKTMTVVLKYYLPTTTSSRLTSDDDGLLYRARRAFSRRDLGAFIATVEEFNTIVLDTRQAGDISATIDSMPYLPLEIVERVIEQVYSRVVSPRTEILKKYEGFSDNTYGEILPKFSSQIFRETQLDSSSVFLDLGSGVGNVVLQAALEIGCESHGIEMMENPSALACAQTAEFKARCHLWGLSTGSVNIIQGDFLESAQLGEILKRADVLLVNNQAFTPALNQKLIPMFLDLKEGARIVSLKSFVPKDWKLKERNSGSIIGMLSVEEKDYWTEEYVSWTNQGGHYFIATKDTSRLANYLGSAIR